MVNDYETVGELRIVKTTMHKRLLTIVPMTTQPERPAFKSSIF